MLLFDKLQVHMQRSLEVTRNGLNISQPVFQASLRRAKSKQYKEYDWERQILHRYDSTTSAWNTKALESISTHKVASS